jgi:hypothetical protein
MRSAPASPLISRDSSHEEQRKRSLRLFLKNKELSSSGSGSGSFTYRLRTSQRNCDLDKTVEKVIGLFSEGREFRSRGDSMNYVFPIIDKSTSSEVIGYLKIGREGERGGGAMETFMYYISIYFGISKFFTETTSIKITPRKLSRLSIVAPACTDGRELHTSLDEVIKERGKRNSLGDMLNNKSTSGSFQPALNGKTLKSCIKDGLSLSSIIQDPKARMIQFVSAFLYTIILGMFDANSGNIIVSGCQFKFFDNTRCLPHSLEFIIWGMSLLLAFRSSFLEFEEAHQNLSEELLSFLEMEIERISKKMDNMEQFLQKEDVKKATDQLPKGWFYPKNFVKVMRIKLDILRGAAQKKKILKCTDMIYAVYPHYRFLTVLFITREYLSKKRVIDETLSIKGATAGALDDLDYTEFWRRGLLLAPSIDVIQLLHEVYYLGLNVKEILGECLKEDFSYLVTLKKIYKKIRFISELQFIDDTLESIDKIKREPDKERAKSLFGDILKTLRDIEGDRQETHKHTIESLHRDIESLSNFVSSEKDQKSVAHRLRYIQTAREIIEELGNDVLDSLMTEKDEKEFKYIIDYIYEQASPDFKDIPEDKIQLFSGENLESELERSGIKTTNVVLYDFDDYVVEIAKSEKGKPKKYFLKYKKQGKKISIMELDVYSIPGFVKFTVNKKVETMTTYQFVKWVPRFVKK